MTSKVSRLDRQVILLETGSTQTIRNVAADQLGELAKQHPEDILSLLSRVYPFLSSKKWETRVTAARAMGGILSNASVWDPNEGEVKEEEESHMNSEIKKENQNNDHAEMENTVIKEEPDQDNGVSVPNHTNNDNNIETVNAKVKLEQDIQLKLEELIKEDSSLLDDNKNADNCLTLSNWHLNELFKSGKVFLASSINDYDDKKVASNSPSTLSSDIEDASMKKENDAENHCSKSSNTEGGNSSKKSARMLAMAKRKKKMQKSKTTTTMEVNLSESSLSKKLMDDPSAVKSDAVKMENPKLAITDQADPNAIMVEAVVPKILEKHEKVAGLVWQFQGVFELLLQNLMHDNWEVRHGATLGLRELMKKHAYGINRIKGKTRKENNDRNYQGLEDLATRLLTIFALDRFGDYIYDTVVAPVRESAAQILAALLINLPDDLALKVYMKLEDLVFQNPEVTGLPNKIWEATHGGLLGIRYFVSIKQEFLIAQNLLDKVVQTVLYGLIQNDDDVKSVAASILTPITAEFVKLDTDTLDIVLTTIWNSLIHLDDDLASSVGSVMDLLANLCQYKEVLDVLKHKATEQPLEWSFKSLVPKLYPFLRHSISSVRKSVLNLLQSFLSIKDESTKHWLNGKVFRLVFQNILFEQNPDILNLSYEVYTSLLTHYQLKHTEKTLDHAFCKHLQPLLHLLNTPIGEKGKNYSMESHYILKPSPRYQLHPEKKRSISEANNASDIPNPRPNENINIDIPMINGDVTLLGEQKIMNTRVLAAKAFGFTLAMFQEATVQSFFANVLVRCLDLPYATPRMLTAIIVNRFCKFWVDRHDDVPEVPKFVSEIFSATMNEQLNNPSKLPVFRELIPSLKALRTSCQNLFATFVDVGMLPQHKLPSVAIVVQGESEAGPEAFGLETAEKVYHDYYDKMYKNLGNSYKLLAKKPLEDAKHRVKQSIESAKESKQKRICSILSNYASSVLMFSELPPKLNPIIRSLMDSVKEEPNEALQKMSCESVIYLIHELLKCNKAPVANKIVKNLCGFLCVDTSEVPDFQQNLSYQDRLYTFIKEPDAFVINENVELMKVAEEARLKRKGGIYAMGTLLEICGSSALDDIPQLKKVFLEPLENISDVSSIDVIKGQAVTDYFGIVRVLFPYMDQSLQESVVIAKFPRMLDFLKCPYSVIRYSVARTFADLAKYKPIKVMPFLIKNVLPMINDAGSLFNRQGATELIFHLSVSMEADILPYVIFLIVPLLGRMSDPNEDIRNLATTTFASIIKIVPLEEGIKDPEGMPEELMKGRERERDFIKQMMDPSKAKPFKLPVAIKATLRKYQQDGINWLAFLNKYHLHGILCDDMGLGKTLQTICIIASDQYLRQEEYKLSGNIECRPLPSLIVCPPSLTGHWENEFEQYSPFLKIVVYAGGPSVRQPLRKQLSSADIIITSYDVARNDLDTISSYDYNYCVLDEGHLIKNAQSKLAKAVKLIKANHRLILTGTPIQNNVVELWSLFDFLMPGFLGTEKSFQERFAKPIAASRNSKTSSKEQEAGALALEALHKQVLPFMLRRLKEDVLSDLPPKIIQDYYCELSDLQKQLYEDFAKKQKNVVEKDIQNTADVDSKQHIFQALQYMRKLCNHPALVLSNDHPQLKQIQNYLKQTGCDLHDIRNAPKLTALRTLLFECGIGEADMDKKVTGEQLLTGSVISQHRALIFCQLKDMLDMIENDLFKRYMPSVSYMRLDGSVDPRDRQKVVRKFNEDPSIDCLLLTTKVGGLGLNLTGADTVIFVEHDWNPMNDLQAMDRAHRLGQKKVVNVYRIVTKGTLEEKIMGLQKFKMNIASTVVNQQNSGLASMDTHQLLDLFDTDNVPSNNAGEVAESGDKLPDDVANETGLSGKAKEALGDLKELWDPSQYEDEYNLDNFIKTLK